ncbi:O-antigen ligase family protein [Acidaminococcus fermentans]|uniref:O-antigen ligase family protein n=1 Tax=Acidaminococcus fermentans TaxID=905 RepID=UPI002E787662|nr:O-antigen ligase family protein [Acidaminococcus fermentans]MEE1598206.1 O-antigen ligase family protein [Acidaminococcus fermentans]MEE4122468.1 O-antigen ligase family protein [Acidaminococcus fermentans]
MYSPKSDGSTYDLVNKDRMVVKKSSIVGLILLIILILPSAVFSLGSVYESLTPANISYEWLNYKFGILQVIICLVGTIEIICQKQFIFLIVSGLELIREVIFYLIYDNSIFSDSAYEMYLTFFVGYSLFLITRRYMCNFQMMDKFYGLFLITNMLTIYINMAMGGRGTTSLGNGIEGRYHASNLDVGGTGTLCLICILYLYFSNISNKYRYPLILLCLTGLVLSGSRSALAFLILLSAGYFFEVIQKRFKSENFKINVSLFFKLMLLLPATGMIVSCIFFYDSSILNRLDFHRFEALLSLSSFYADESVSGRFTSIKDGLDIIANYPLGISGYFVNLQNEMSMRGFPTFPHSSLLSAYILFGPITFFFYFVWIKFLTQNNQHTNKYFWIVLYYLFSTIFYGGPIVNFKVIFAMILSTYLGYKSFEEKR